ncbi:MAG: hypothetical protein ACE5Q6_00365 [Dehalococcoidia bacterium]
MRRNIGLVVAMLVLSISAFTMLGAGPSQGGLPPQPFLSDYFSGRVFIQGARAPFGTILVACVDDCQTGFESKPVVVGARGEYRLLEINPEERLLRGRDVSFYLVNEYGRIRAEETARFEGAYNLNKLVLTFPDPMPAPPPIPGLPAVGDSRVPEIPKFALGLGSAAAVTGIFLLLVSRRSRAF